MTSDGFKCYEYNEANQLAKAKECGSSLNIAEYTYDYNGNRMVKKNYLAGTHKNTVTSWSDSFETKSIVGGATENTSYYFVNGELLSKKDKDGNRTYMHNDHLGSISLTTDASGNESENTEYDPWGQILSGGTKSKYLYTGQEYDAETGLDYYNYRYYNSDIRRFNQPDDIIQDPYRPQTLNKYSYVDNNPLKYTDPTGHVAVVPILLVGGGVGLVAGIADVALNNPNPTWQDYAVGGAAGFGTGVVTSGLTLMATPAIASGLAIAKLSPAIRPLVAASLAGGGVNVGQNMFNNARTNNPITQNNLKAFASGTIMAGVSTYGAAKIVPESVGRPTTKLNLSLNVTQVSKKSAEQVTRHAVNETISNVTMKIVNKLVSNVKKILKWPFK